MVFGGNEKVVAAKDERSKCLTRIVEMPSLRPVVIEVDKMVVLPTPIH